MPTAATYRRLMERLPIRTPALQIVPLRFNAAQERLFDLLAPALEASDPIRVIILKPRRTGMSTFCEALLTATCVLNQQVRAKVVAHESVATQNIWDMSAMFVEQSPLKAIGQVKGQRITFGSSRLDLATAGSPNAARGSDLTVCHLSEVSAWKDPEAMLATLQCLPREYGQFSMALIESTARGMVGAGELFHQHWQRAVSGKSPFTPFFFGWLDFPTYSDPPYDVPLDDLDADEQALYTELGATWGQLRWRRRILAADCEDDPELFAQEYPSTDSEAFIMAGLPFFTRAQLLWLEPHMEPGVVGRLDDRGGRLRFVPDPGGYLTVFRRPRDGHEYVIGADSSMGFTDVGTTGSHSRSAAEVLDMETLEQVAEYDAASAPHVFAKHLAQLGRFYKEALLCPEVQGSGGGGGRELLVWLRDTHNYHHLHIWRHPDRIKQGNGTLYGFETTARTRPRMIARLREVMLEHSCVLHSRPLLTQMRNFGENDSGRLEALAGHDDLLFGLMLALISRSENYVATRLLGTQKDPMYGDLSLNQLGLANWPDVDDLFERHKEIVEAQAMQVQAYDFLRA
jgi:hypothetical protein